MVIDSETPINEKSFQNVLQLLSSNGLEGAMVIVEEEIAKEPECWEAWSAKADILYLMKRYDEALECCNKALSFNAENALAWYTKGNTLYMLKRYDQALECYNMSINIDPLFVRAWYNKKLALDLQLKEATPKIYPVRKTRPKKGTSDTSSDGDTTLGIKK